MKKLINLTFLTLILSCTTIASLTEEPTPPKGQTLTELNAYEAKLSDYVMYLQVFLTRTKKKVNDPNYPKFTILMLPHLNQTTQLMI
ncbi:Outer surface protein (plasmid) [Borrelia coriaceae ATCC 43381]|uniref:Outer surface protein n=1 Tax=Borrelia coriaceae ATCC 43381 TaxID=1408429 RepID=W5SXA7_9SPIR|nr:Outer surface protein [Borrelia coriaceae ATCC 43381]